MARLMGFPSYAEYQLDSFSLAGQPAAVGSFLGRLADAIAPKAAAEAAELGYLKRRLFGSGSLQPWDKQYLVAAAEAGAGGGSSSSSSGGSGSASASSSRAAQAPALPVGPWFKIRESGPLAPLAGVLDVGARRVLPGHLLRRSQVGLFSCRMSDMQAGGKSSWWQHVLRVLCVAPACCLPAEM